MAETEILWKRGRTLGKGGFGFVSLASTHSTTDTHIPSLIAVKSCMLSCSESLQDETEFLTMFEKCPHVIRCFGFKVTQEDDMLLYNLLLEYASAGSLADRLLNNHELGLPEFQVKKHTKNVVLGLSYIHGKGIIHCDIKPHNILLTSNDDDDHAEEMAKIADFGLSLTLEQSCTQNQGLRGTERYMAPESLRNHEYGPEADIWALGCTVYELITGTPLWESSNSDPKSDNVPHRIKYEEPNLENAKLSTDATDFLRNCLVKDPSSRWTADMLLNHSFLKAAVNVQPPKTRKRQGGCLYRPHQKRAFRTQPHIRDLVIQH